MNQNILKTKVIEFRKEHGINETEPLKLESLLLNLNIVALFKRLSDSFSGMAIRTEECNFILINSAHSLGRQNFTACHELYHIFVQEEFESNLCMLFDTDGKSEEKHADSFAALLLIPEAGLLQIIPEEEQVKNRITLQTILKAENIFGCSRKALLKRLEELSLIDIKKAVEFDRDVKKMAKLNGYSTELYNPGRENKVIGNYGERARRLFENEVISESNFAGLLSDIGINIYEEDESNGEDT